MVFVHFNKFTAISKNLNHKMQFKKVLGYFNNICIDLLLYFIGKHYGCILIITQKT